MLFLNIPVINKPIPANTIIFPIVLMNIILLKYLLPNSYCQAKQCSTQKRSLQIVRLNQRYIRAMRMGFFVLRRLV